MVHKTIFFQIYSVKMNRVIFVLIVILHFTDYSWKWKIIQFFAQIDLIMPWLKIHSTVGHCHWISISRISNKLQQNIQRSSNLHTNVKNGRLSLIACIHTCDVLDGTTYHAWHNHEAMFECILINQNQFEVLKSLSFLRCLSISSLDWAHSRLSMTVVGSSFSLCI